VSETAASPRAARSGVFRRVREESAARAVVWVAALVAGAQAAIGVGNELSLESRFLNPDAEGSLFQLLTAAFTLVGAGAAAAHARALAARRTRFVALALLLLYLAADDLLVIHERVGERLGEGLLGLPGHVAVRLWIVGLAPLLLAVVWLVATEAIRVGRPLGRVLLGGLAALAAAVVVEAAGVVTRSPEFIERVSGKPETLRYLIEETFELGGWALVAGGLVALLARDTHALGR
jgi:hypothetical protein